MAIVPAKLDRENFNKLIESDLDKLRAHADRVEADAVECNTDIIRSVSEYYMGLGDLTNDLYGGLRKDIIDEGEFESLSLKSRPHGKRVAESLRYFLDNCFCTVKVSG